MLIDIALGTVALVTTVSKLHKVSSCHCSLLSELDVRQILLEQILDAV